MTRDTLTTSYYTLELLVAVVVLVFLMVSQRVSGLECFAANVTLYAAMLDVASLYVVEDIALVDGPLPAHVTHPVLGPLVLVHQPRDLLVQA